MRTRTTAAAVTLLAALALAGCSDDNDTTARKLPPGSYDCTDTASMSQAEWMAKCAGGSGAMTTPPAQQYTAPVGGQKIRMPNGIELSMTVEPIPIAAPGVSNPPSGSLTQNSKKPGETPVLVTLTITNGSAAPYDVSPMFIREMTGTVNGGKAQGWAYGNVDLHDAEGTIAPGRSTTETKGYALPDSMREGYRVTVAMQTGFGEILPDAEFTGSFPPASSPAAPTPAAS